MDVDFAAVYAEAVKTTQNAKDARDALLETPDQFVSKVTAVRTQVMEDLLREAPGKIMDAAQRGMSTVDLMNFNGNEFKDDVSLLFLFRGPRPMTPPVPKGTPGPLLPDLQAVMAPFEIVHDWDGISGGNRILARWVTASLV